MEEYPLMFMNTPASLQYLTSAEMALMVWRCKYASTSHLYDTPRSFLGGNLRKFGCKEVLVVPIPRRIEALINDHILRIGGDLYSWIEFHADDRKFLDGSCAEEFCRYFKHLVVDFTGSIGFKASAENILNSGEFSDDVLNYEIACTFCLEDQVKRFWPSVENDARIKDVKFGHDTCYLLYWHGCMKSGNSINDAELAKILILHTVGSHGYNGTAFDYFYKMLPDHERESVFEFLISEAGYVYTALIFYSSSFHKLDRFQAERLFKRAAGWIFTFLFEEEYYFQFALRLWTRMGHLVLEDASISHRVIDALWEALHAGYEFNYIHDLMVEIWSDASDELKSYISDGYLTYGYDCGFS
ncbi:uncharacterized protein LOC135839895 [Planococcus citri]|uniref:uncharacterized protein LOC135839895 n=1 Tax=Planococcus citri TaxID=170843 RepID=UPI0031F8D7F2